MALNQNELLLVEAVASMQLGLDQHADQHEQAGKLEHGPQYLHQQINDMFRIKAAALHHYTGICAAFTKVHGYKYVDDHTFSVAFRKELTAQGIPQAEITRAIEFIPAIIRELGEDAEADSGFHPDLDDLMAIPGDRPAK